MKSLGSWFEYDLVLGLWVKSNLNPDMMDPFFFTRLHDFLIFFLSPFYRRFQRSMSFSSSRSMLGFLFLFHGILWLVYA